MVDWNKARAKAQAKKAPVAAQAPVAPAPAESSTPWLSKLAGAVDTAAHYFPLTAPAAWAGEGVASLLTGDKQKQRELAARAMGGAQSLSLGHADEASGLMAAQPQFARALNPFSDVTMEDAGDAYRAGQQKYLGMDDAVRAWSSKQDSLVGPYAQGELAGTAAMIATPGGAAKGAGMAAGGLKGLAQSVLGTAAKSGLMGAVAGEGYSTATTPEGVLSDAGDMAQKAALIGGGLRLVPAAVRAVAGPQAREALDRALALRQFGKAKNAPKALPSPNPANAPIPAPQAPVPVGRTSQTLALPSEKTAAMPGRAAPAVSPPAGDATYVSDTAIRPMARFAEAPMPPPGPAFVGEVPKFGTPEFQAAAGRAFGQGLPLAAPRAVPVVPTVNQRMPVAPAPAVAPVAAPSVAPNMRAAEEADILARGGGLARKAMWGGAKSKALPAAAAGLLMGGPPLAAKLAVGGAAAGAIGAARRAAGYGTDIPFAKLKLAPVSARAYLMKKILGLSDDTALAGDAATQQTMRYMASQR